MPLHESPTLADLLVIVPDLLPSHILTQWRSPAKGTRDLRLVSKEVASITESAIKACKVQLGHRTRLSAQQAVRLVKQARLKRMVVEVEVQEGKFLFYSCRNTWTVHVLRKLLACLVCHMQAHQGMSSDPQLHHASHAHGIYRSGIIK